ncbi:MAG: chromosomal replication initiator protein DnaA [Xanthomonadaceae bacterium]|nr:chromosomal replication initiator protein DnaA [Xanthomonadaceae bacterium]
MRTFNSEENKDWPIVWRSAYELLEKSYGSSGLLKAWVQPLVWNEMTTEGGEIHVSFFATTPTQYDYVIRNFKDRIESALEQITGSKCKISLVQNSEINTNTAPFEPKTAEVLLSKDAHSEPKITSFSTQSRVLDDRYTFDTFVVGSSNQFAHASAVAVAEKPGAQYNPLFIYSSPGLGKTHLLHAIGNYVLSQKKNAKVQYVSAEQFGNELIVGIKDKGDMAAFRRKWRDSFDVLLIDDIQFIAGKEAIQEEFFHTFNALYSSRRQIVVTSDRPPKDIREMEERIRTRFEMGLVSDIQPPEIETRIAILKAKAERDDLYLPDEVATLIATHVKGNVRVLEGFLVKLQADAALTGTEISLEMAKNLLQIRLPEETPESSVEQIQAAVAKYFHIRVQDLKSKERTQNIASARHIAMYLIRKYTPLTYQEVAKFFGGRDHSTVIHAVKRIADSVETDPELNRIVTAIQSSI